jgi:hypothetical protein
VQRLLGYLRGSGEADHGAFGSLKYATTSPFGDVTGPMMGVPPRSSAHERGFDVRDADIKAGTLSETYSAAYSTGFHQPRPRPIREAVLAASETVGGTGDGVAKLQPNKAL